MSLLYGGFKGSERVNPSTPAGAVKGVLFTRIFGAKALGKVPDDLKHQTSKSIRSVQKVPDRHDLFG